MPNKQVSQKNASKQAFKSCSVKMLIVLTEEVTCEERGLFSLMTHRSKSALGTVAIKVPKHYILLTGMLSLHIKRVKECAQAQCLAVNW